MINAFEGLLIGGYRMDSEVLSHAELHEGFLEYFHQQILVEHTSKNESLLFQDI